MSEHDPLDEMFERAFQSDAAGIPQVDVAGKVIERLRRRRQVRTGVLCVAMASGVAALAAFLPPALDSLLADIPWDAAAGWGDNTVVLAMAGVAVAAWLLMMEEELG